MGNKNKENRGMIDRQQRRVDQGYGGLTDFARSGGDFGQGREDNSRRMAEQGFTGGGGYNPQSYLNADGGYGGGGVGGFNIDFTGANAGDFGSARAGYEDFAKTGGVDATALRQRATGQIPGFYDQYKQSAQRRSNVQGGYSPGFDAQQAEIGRQAGRAGFQASRDVEGDIADKTQAGRLQGLGGLTQLGGLDQNLNMFNQGQRQSLDEGNANRGLQAGMFNSGQNLEGQRLAQNDRQFGANFGENARQFNAQGMAGLNAQDYDRTGRNMGMYGQGLAGQQGAFGQNQGLRQNVSGSMWGGLGRGLFGAGTSLLTGGMGNVAKGLLNRGGNPFNKLPGYQGGLG